MKLRSIHSDKRGNVYAIEGKSLQYPEIAMLTINKGYARGGCIHNIHDEYFVVIQGRVDYRIGDTTHNYSVGDSGIIPKGTPHYLYAYEDSIVLEWGATIEEKQEKHETFRKIVENINEKRL